MVSDLADALARAAEVAPILLVEQNLALVTKLAREVVVMAEGRVVHAGVAQDLFDDPEHNRSLLGVARRAS